MIELGDLVVFTPCQRSYSKLHQLAAAVAFKKLKEKVSCGVVIDRFNKNDSPVLKVMFPEGSYNMKIDQVTTISKWYVGEEKKL